ncbi:Uncharacterised protein [Mycobacteroides abscessus subsp. bolletii]|nr:Uncharacterised protein [Mycobacteroides abscessus subsp. bolletii]
MSVPEAAAAATHTPANPGEVTSRRLNMGAGVRPSHQRNNARATTAQSARVAQARAPIPPPCREITANTPVNSPQVSSIVPTQSTGRVCSARVSGRWRAAMINAITPTGRFTRKIDCHPKWVTRNPPNSGPAALPAPMTAP